MILRSLLRDEKGAAAEFALVLPLVLILIFGIIDAGRFMWAYNRAEKATQMGARVAVVTNVIAPGLATASYVGQTVGGVTLTQGDRIPAAALGKITCSSSSGTVSCACTTNPCPALGTPAPADFTRVVTAMQNMESRINADNVQIVYQGSGLGFAGDPTGAEISPLVTVRLSSTPSATALKFTPITSLLFATLTMPSFSTTLTGEDLSGSQSN